MNLLDPYTFFFDLPLYTHIEISSNNSRDFDVLMSADYQIDAYNPSLKQETTYHVNLAGTFVRGTALSRVVGYYEFDLACVRNGYRIKTYVSFLRDGDDTEKSNFLLTKIGQSPSIANLHISKIRNYDKILDKEKIKEFTRAIGLAANGVGIGSYVYLRRIFEYLIEDAHNSAISDVGWDEELYQKNRVVERIDQLHTHLPEFLVRNKNIYGILSLGIHSLNENDCLKHFDSIKLGIELILDEKLERLTKEKKIEDAQKRIQTVIQMTKGK